MPALRLDTAPAPRADDAKLDAGLRRRGNRAREILARLERSDRERVIAFRTRPFGREDVVDRVRRDDDLVTRDPEHLHKLRRGVLRDCEHACRGAQDTW